MNRALTCMMSASLIAGGAAALQSAAAQEGTIYPGQPTQARVWIENRDRAEAVPVSIETIAPDSPPIRVQVVGVPAVTFGGEATMNARVSRQAWEYQNMRVPLDGNAAGALNAAGMDGWETTGLAFPSGKDAVVVMKRPR